MAAFNFASRTFAYSRLAKGLSRALSTFSSFFANIWTKLQSRPMLMYPICTQSIQYVDDIDIAANDAEQLINNLRATFQFIQKSGLKLRRHKCHFVATETDFLGRFIICAGVKPPRPTGQNFLENTKFFHHFKNYRIRTL